MKVLFVTPRPPYPPHKGDQLIAHNQIKKLGKYCDIFLVSFITDTTNTEEILKEYKDYCKKIYFIKLSSANKFSLIKSFFNFKPFQVNFFNRKKHKKQINEIIDFVKPDLIHIQTFRIAELFMDSKIPKTIDLIDAISLNMKRRAKNENIFLKLPFHLESYFCSKYEKKVLDNYNKAFLVSKNDKIHLDNDEIIINPNGTFIDKKLLDNYEIHRDEFKIMFHGNMNYFPNIEAATYLIKEIYPKLKTTYPDIKIYIVGKNPAPKIKDLHDGKNIFITGFVDDIMTYLTESLIGVYPLLSGSGMQNKILEALASGLPSVSSQMALNGIENINDTHIYKAKNADEFVEKIIFLKENKYARDELSISGQKFIFNNFSWESNTKNFITLGKNY